MLNRLRDVFASFQMHDVRYVVIGEIFARKAELSILCGLCAFVVEYTNDSGWFRIHQP
jgi:hypothetical protein